MSRKPDQQPTVDRLRDRARRTHDEAMSIIAQERAARLRLTEKQRAARLEKEGVEVPKPPRKRKPRAS